MNFQGDLIGLQGELLLLISFVQPLDSSQTSTHVGSRAVHSLAVMELVLLVGVPSLVVEETCHLTCKATGSSVSNA